MTNKYNALETSWSHLPLAWSVEKMSSMKLVPGAKTVEDHCIKASKDDLNTSAFQKS